MNTLKRRVELLKNIKLNNVLNFFCLMHIQAYRAQIDFLSNETTLLHEVRSAEMLAFLLWFKMDIRTVNCQNKTAIHSMKKRLKALKKEKKFLKSQAASFKKISVVNEKIKKQAEAVQLLSLVNKNIFLKKGLVETSSLFEDSPYLKNLKREGTFGEQVKKKRDFFEHLAAYLTHYSVEKIKQVDKTNELLIVGGLKKEKVHLSYRLVQNNPQARMLYQQDEKGGPLLLFRGTTNSKDTFAPLSHFGTLKAAKDRLDTLEEVMNVPNSWFHCHMTKEGWNPIFQIKPVYLKMKNPFRIPELGKHSLDRYKNVLTHFLLREKYGAIFINRLYLFSLENFVHQFKKTILPKEYDFIFMHPYTLTTNQVKKELFLGGLYPVLSEKMDPSAQSKNLENLMFQRLIRFFERRGYDGFVYKNGWEDAGNDSFITFRKEQVVLASQMDKKQLISPIQIPHEKELLKLENRYLSSCKERSLKHQIGDCGYNPLFLKEYGLHLVPKKIREAFTDVCDLIEAKIFHKKFHSR